MRPLSVIFTHFSKQRGMTSAMLRPSVFNIPLRRFASVTQKVPSLGDSISEGTIQEYLKQVGDYVAADEPIAMVETDKVTVEIRAKNAGVITKLYVDEGETILVDGEFCDVDTEGKAPAGGAAAPPPPAAEPAKAATPPPKAEAAPASPAPPAPSAPTPAPKPAAASKSAPPSGTVSGGRGENRVKMSRMRMRIAERLKDAQNTNAMLTTFNEVDMSYFMDLRKKYGDAFLKKHGVKLGFMSAFVKGSVAALRQQPAVNAVIEGNEIIYRDYVDISVAVATPSGLVVPVLRNCEEMSYADVEKGLIDLSIKARDGKIQLEDMTGGTFTISNGGVYGSMMGTPIINPPQSAILGMHGIKNRPVCVGDKILARPMMYLALTYDHRLIDGREAVLFLRKVKEAVEEPQTVLFDL